MNQEAAFLKIEEKYNLYQLEIENVPYWMYSRYNIWTDFICVNSFGTAPIQKKVRLKFKDFFTNISQIINSYRVQHSSSIANNDICIIGHERRVKIDDYYQCIYTERFANKYKSSVTLERPYENKHLQPVKADNLLYLDNIILSSITHFYFHYALKTRRYKRIYDRAKQQLNSALNEMIQVCKCDIQLDKIYKKIVQKILVCEIQQKKLQKLFDKINPKLVLEVVSYSSVCMIMNRIAFQRGIPTLELQHGTIHSQHIGYMYNSKETFPELPSKILSFSEFWRNNIKMPLAEENIIPVGFPYFEENFKKYPKKKNNCKIHKVLFLSQATIGLQLSSFASELDSIIDRERFQLIYKLHPSEYSIWREKYPWLVSCGIEVVDNNQKNLYEYFSECDIQVGVYSTALYEGLGYNLHTFIYNTTYADTMSELINGKYATLIKDSHEFIEHLNKTVGLQKTAQESFWISNSIDNICKIIDACLDRQREEN